MHILETSIKKEEHTTAKHIPINPPIFTKHNVKPNDVNAPTRLV